MKQDLRAWIDKEIDRLDKEVRNETPEDSDVHPVPDVLRHALAGATGKPHDTSGRT